VWFITRCQNFKCRKRKSNTPVTPAIDRTNHCHASRSIYERQRVKFAIQIGREHERDITTLNEVFILGEVEKRTRAINEKLLVLESTAQLAAWSREYG